MALATLFLPTVILVVRSVWLYQVDEFLQMALALIAFVGLHSSAQIFASHSVIKQSINWLSVITAGFIALPTAQWMHAIMPVDIGLSIFSLVFALFTLIVALRDNQYRHRFINTVGLSLSFFHLLQLGTTGGLLSASLCLLAGVAVFMFGKIYGQKILLFTGASTALAGLVWQVHQVFGAINFSSWITLSAIGVSAIVLASLLERHGAALKLKWSQWSTNSETV